MQRIIGCLAAAAIITLMFGSVYISFQQAGRQTANGAPRSAAAAQVQLMGTDAPAPRQLELTPDSGIFWIIYGEDDNPVSGTVTLHGKLPVVPAGVLDAARTSGSDAVTWQPEPGLRMAVVAKPAGAKVVVAGQSLTPFEDRDRMVQLFLGAGWLGSLALLGAGYAATTIMARRPLRDEPRGRSSLG